MVLGRHVTEEYEVRLDRVVELARQNPASRILVLGGKPHGEELSEAQLGRDYLIEKGIDPGHIVLEQESRHTLENMLHARELLQQQQDQSVVLVTSRYHLARAQGLAISLGITHQLCAAEEHVTVSPNLMLHMVREAYYLNWLWAARMWARLTGRTGHVGHVQ